MKLVDDNLHKLVDCIFDTHPDGDLDCEECCKQFNCLVELVASGAEMGKLLPAVEEHLMCCPDCREEFQALLSIVIAENQGLLKQEGQEAE
jgi:predicted anti-sigma-YlaC factor YlaD